MPRPRLVSIGVSGAFAFLQVVAAVEKLKPKWLGVEYGAIIQPSIWFSWGGTVLC